MDTHGLTAVPCHASIANGLTRYTATADICAPSCLRKVINSYATYVVISTKRTIASELIEGFDALADERQGKITLRTHQVHLNKLAPLTADEVIAVRQQLNLSRSVFAMYLRTNIRTLENWEQGRAKPNAQAVTLIRLVARFPKTVAQLAALG